MIRLFRSKPNNYSFWFVSIRHYSTLYSESCRIICLVSLRFASFCFVLRFESPLFWLVSIRLKIQSLCIRFGHESNYKNHYSPKLSLEWQTSRLIIRFGEPAEKTSGFQIVRLSDVRFTPLYPVSGWISGSSIDEIVEIVSNNNYIFYLKNWENLKKQKKNWKKQ